MSHFINTDILRSTVSKSAILVYHLIKDGRKSFADLLAVGICKKTQLSHLLNELKKSEWITQTERGIYEVCEKFEENLPQAVQITESPQYTNTVLVGICPISGESCEEKRTLDSPVRKAGSFSTN